jgi:hypothetical protein
VKVSTFEHSAWRGPCSDRFPPSPIRSIQRSLAEDLDVSSTQTLFLITSRLFFAARASMLFNRSSSFLQG